MLMPTITSTSSTPVSQICRTVRRTIVSSPSGKSSFCLPIRDEAPAASTTALTMAPV